METLTLSKWQYERIDNEQYAGIESSDVESNLHVKLFIEQSEDDVKISLTQQYFFPNTESMIKAQFDDNIQHFTLLFNENMKSKTAYIKEAHTFLQSLLHHETLTLSLLSEMMIPTTFTTKMVPFPRKVHFKIMGLKEVWHDI
jgi:hypothetical protein